MVEGVTLGPAQAIRRKGFVIRIFHLNSLTSIFCQIRRGETRAGQGFSRIDKKNFDLTSRSKRKAIASGRPATKFISQRNSQRCGPEKKHPEKTQGAWDLPRKLSLYTPGGFFSSSRFFSSGVIGLPGSFLGAGAGFSAAGGGVRCGAGAGFAAAGGGVRGAGLASAGGGVRCCGRSLGGGVCGRAAGGAGFGGGCLFSGRAGSG